MTVPMTMHEADDGREYHFVPVSEPSHALSRRCYCCPVVDYEDAETGIKVWKHHSRGEAI